MTDGLGDILDHYQYREHVASAHEMRNRYVIEAMVRLKKLVG